VPGREALLAAALLFAVGLFRAAWDAHPALREAVARLLP
jgi:hypothetical protein